MFYWFMQAMTSPLNHPTPMNTDREACTWSLVRRSQVIPISSALCRFSAMNVAAMLAEIHQEGPIKLQVLAILR